MEKLKEEIQAEVLNRIGGTAVLKVKPEDSDRFLKDTIVTVFLEKINGLEGEYGIRFTEDPFDFHVTKE